MKRYIYEYEQWPDFYWEHRSISSVFGQVRIKQGLLIGHMNALGFSHKNETVLTSLTMDVVKSSEIEGEFLSYEQVRSSIARRLGINTAGLVNSTRHIDGVVSMLLDATQNYSQPITEKRLFGWHASLFPTGYSGNLSIEVGKYRTGEMQIVSGPIGKEKVHYEAIKASQVKKEMKVFLNWLNNENELDLVLKAAIAHFWFIIIHPFDDGNGRIARAITDLLLARSENSGERFYSMSNQILKERKKYYQILQQVQHSTGDITEWVVWFMDCLKNSIDATEHTTQRIIQKAVFWKKYDKTSFNERQRLVLNKLLDGFEGKLQTSKWAKITKTSNDTALRDIKDLIQKGILKQTKEGGRNSNYELKKVKLKN